jgi:4-hydroxythreonine-4-phosphate dehydrogenase
MGEDPLKKPIIAMTMGDAFGIGPELIVKVLSREETYSYCRPFVIGSRNVMEAACRIVGKSLPLEFSFPRLNVLCPDGVEVPEIRWGQLDPAGGKAAALCLERAFKMASEKRIDGVVSAPLNKDAFHRAGYNHVDELEFLGELTESREPFVIGVVDSIWIVPVTLHVAFRNIAAVIKKDRVLRYIRLLDEALRKVGLEAPRIAVAALNVHGGEGGLLGREELDEISPAIKTAQEQMICAEGPFPADSLFLKVIEDRFDGVVCMYHDQANIARKLLAKRKGVTLFMGLPVPCGTTTHGTAFDIAGKGVADPGSLESALKYVVRLSVH